MSRAVAALDRRVLPAWPAVAALGVCIVLGAALVELGLVVAFAILALAGIVLIIRRPGIGLAVLLVSTVALEADPYGFLPITAKYYEGPPSMNEVVMATAAVGVLLDLGIRHRLPVLPEPFTLPLALLGLAFLFGAVNGHFQNGRISEVFFAARPMGYMVLVSFLVVNLLSDRRRVRLFAFAAAALAVFKGLEGTAAWLLGAGRPLDEGGVSAVLTYYEPTANFLMLVFLLTAAAAVLMRVPVPLSVKLASPFVLAAFILSFRRSFWIALGLALVLTIMLTSGIPGRRLVFPTMLALMASVWIALAAGGATQIEGPVAQRVRTLAPTSLSARKEDVYRLQEIKNVVLELRNHPIAGLGLGVPWSEVEHALPEEHPGGRYYTHVVVFWYWLKFGLLGVAAYSWLLIAAILTSIRIWRFSHDVFLKVVGLGTATSLVGLMVAETTGSFTGADYRFSVIMGALFGWLAAARMHGVRTERTVG